MPQTMTPSELADHCGDDLFPCPLYSKEDE
jgi:hypothetical protein